MAYKATQPGTSKPQSAPVQVKKKVFGNKDFWVVMLVLFGIVAAWLLFQAIAMGRAFNSL